MARNNRSLVAACLALAVAGCDPRHDVYRLQLRPTSGGLERTLTAWREVGGEQPNVRIDDDERRRLSALYDECLTPPNELRQTFRGTFPARLPADVGGSGTYRTVETPLGSAHWYVERFRGTDDPDAEWFRRRTAVDRAVDLAVGWFEQEMKDSPHRDRVRRFLHQEFRQDLRNTALLAWRLERQDLHEGNAADGERTKRLPDAAVAVLAHLIERGYLEPTGTATLELRGNDEPEHVLRWIRETLARKSGLSAAADDEPFPFLVDPEKVRTSWADYLRKTPEYAQRQKTWRPDQNRPEVTGPDPFEVFEDLFGQASAIVLFGKPDVVEIELTLPVRPFETNGDYDEPAGALRWRAALPGARALPAHCYAAWSVPDEGFQRAHFGQAALVEKGLARFAAAYAELPPARRAEFAAHLATIEPGDALRGRVQDFRFAEPTDDRTRRLGETLVKILADEL